MRLIIITGKSGAGKSVALKTLEDLGFYCIDNLPISLIQNVVKDLSHSENNIAISLDIRNISKGPREVENMFSSFTKEINIQTFFLDASNEKILTRYSETKRSHPLSKKKLSLYDSILEEDKSLLTLKKFANAIIDTTHLSIYELSDLICSKIVNSKHKPMLITVQSFGFKYGIPKDSDYVFDVRFLPNPYWVSHLKKFSGLDEPVINFFNKLPEVDHTILQIYNLINSWLPKLKSNNRSYLTISIGCTGGKHRSVFVAERIGKLLLKHEKNLKIIHSIKV
ncbi:RNase adaptor protein RapZ [Paraphotobacterium marinum]|uniref:RNase adaptor protein RapZ n=1 Tax=Paraphotobacterium marinum TaxID=1755811 RepID=A0A220VC87_9GAMM|nr:RNase adapter RapZ [Paraphotobacterium marinum]ASK77955.1 RNase adaptor protein RapZ [Paraphotobacterium marinum]